MFLPGLFKQDLKDSCPKVIEELVSTDMGPIANFGEFYAYKCGITGKNCGEPYATGPCSAKDAKTCPCYK